MRTLDFLAIEYDQLGTVRTQSGNRSQYAAPGNIYATSDGKWASIAASTQSIFERFCKALGLQHLLADARFADNPSRVKNWQAIDAIVSDAIARLTLEELRSRLHAHEVGFSPIYDAADIFADPHFIARNAIVSVAGRRTRRYQDAMRGAAVFGNAGLGAPRRAVARPAQ